MKSERTSVALIYFAVAIFSRAPAEAASRYTKTAGAEAACNIALSYLERDPPSLPETAESLLREAPIQSPPLPMQVTGTRLLDFDFDNDGILDQVYWYDAATSYVWGTFFYVRRGPFDSKSANEISVEELNVFPCQFDRSAPVTTDCPRFSQNADEAGIDVKVRDGRKSVLFRGRYTAMLPYKYNGKTYLLLESKAYTKRDAALIEPTGGTAFRSVCLFRRRGK